MTTTSDSRAKQLFEEGAGMLAALWDDAVAMVRAAEHPDYHDPRGTLAYVHVLLRAGDVDRAARAIRSVIALQETRPQDAHYGNFRWTLEEPCVTDLNGVEFMLDELIALARERAGVLPAAIVDEMRRAISLGIAEIDRLDVHPSYTNIALSDIANSVLGGELLGDPRSIARGARRLDEWFAFTNASGAPHEFNSATYTAVDIARLASLAAHTRDPRIGLKARIAEERLWLHVAAHYHPGLAQLGGAHSRSYFDGWSGAGGYLKLMLWRLLGDENLRRATPYAPRSREEGHVGLALAELHCRDYVERWLRDKRYPFEARETTDDAHAVHITTYMTPSYALGTASRSYGVGEPPEPWPAFDSVHAYLRRDAAPGYGALYARYVINDKLPGAGAGHGAEDHWDEGRHVAVQHRNRAIVAYGLMPRMRPVHSYKLSIRLLGVSDSDEVWSANRRVETWPATVLPGARIVIAAGDAYVALIPLEQTDMGSDAPIELNLNGGVLTLDIHNYKGPPKTFWEHRSQGGPFYNGNVRSAFALEMAERTDFDDLAAFREHVARSRITDTTDDRHERDVTYESGDTSIALKYSLWDMSLLERRIDGAAYQPPPARVGAAGGGPQFVQTNDGSLPLGRAEISATPGPIWLFADDETRRYLLVNPTDRPMLVRLTTPDTRIDCNAFGFGRIDLDEARGTLNIETADPPGPISVRGGADLKLVVNGKAVALP